MIWSAGVPPALQGTARFIDSNIIFFSILFTAAVSA